MDTRTVMVVEDEGVVAAHLEQALQDMGYHVAGLYARGEDAIEALAEARPDVVLMDIRLRGRVGGIEAARVIQQRDIPVVYLTAYADEAVLREATLTQPYGYLTKPVRDKELRACIEMALYKSRTDRQLRRLNQILRAVRDVNQLITRERDVGRLFSEACRVLAQTQGYDLVWVAKLPALAGEPWPLTWAGARSDLASRLGVGVRETREEAWPWEEAQAAKRVVFCRAGDLAGRPAGWERLVGRGDPPALAVVPLLHGDQVYGVLGIHAGMPGAFDGDETALLEELAGDLAFACRSIDDEAERERAERTLREHERFISAVTQGSPDLILVRDRVGRRLVYANRDPMEVLGYGAQGVRAVSEDELEALVHVEDVPRMREHWAQLSRMADGVVRSLEYRMRRAGGDYAWFMARDTVFRREAATGAVVEILTVSQDITTQKQAESAHARLEAQLRQVAKMEAVGRLAGGVAHDFNNLLTVVLMNASLAANEPQLAGNARDLLRNIMDAAGRAATLTRQLLTFSRQQAMQVQTVDVNQVVEHTMELLRNLLGRKITLHHEMGLGLPIVQADPGMLEQVLVNLALNARDAMPEGGRITFASRCEEVTVGVAMRGPAAAPGPYVVIRVSDTGAGMDAATVVRVFEPFFTTKPVGQGTGLGLALAYGILQQHGGWIEVQSELGKGSAFSLYLPVVAPVRSASAPASATGLPGGGETILVVQREPHLRDLIRACLQLCGYRVLEAEEAAAAMRIWEQNEGRVDLLLLDPECSGGPSGEGLAERLRAQRPSLRVVYASGGDPGQSEAKEKGPGGEVRWAKPYDPGMLARVVRQALDQPVQG